MSLKELLNIGCAADAERHATRLAIRGHDSAGAGSATEVDEEDVTEEERANRDAVEGNDDLDGEDEDGSRRSRQKQAYDEIKSDRDKLRNDLELQKRQNQEFQERLSKIEGEKSAREKTNEQTNSNLSLAKQRAQEIVSENRKIASDDPERDVKIYENFLSRVYDDLPKAAEDISKRTARETFNQERRLDKDQEEAERVTLEAIAEAGLKPNAYKMVKALAVNMNAEDPGWFQRTKPEDQIPELVGMVKDIIVDNKRSSREFQDDKDRHRKPMDGVIEKGSQRRSVRDQDDDEDRPGPGSILADMARARSAKLQSTKVMLRQADSSR